MKLQLQQTQQEQPSLEQADLLLLAWTTQHIQAECEPDFLHAVQHDCLGAGCSVQVGPSVPAAADGNKLCCADAAASLHSLACVAAAWCYPAIHATAIRSEHVWLAVMHTYG